ncbi:MAG: hypothetical protein ACLFT2_01940 [Candidatus Brocadiia bacterium]
MSDVYDSITRTDHRMTLVELVVVLALLASLAGVVVTSVGEVDMRQRYDTTAERMRTIQKAVAGDGVLPGRFILDMGRLPRVPSDPEEGELLSELWSPDGLEEYGKESKSDSDFSWPSDWPTDAPALSSELNDVEMYCGWNGPYLAVSGDRLYDGFGNGWEVSDDGSSWDNASDLSVEDKEIKRIRSLGSNNEESGGSWDEEIQMIDLESALPETHVTIQVKIRDHSSQPAVWRRVKGEAGNWKQRKDDVWAADSGVSEDDYTVSTDLKHYFRADDGGDTGNSEPEWNVGTDATTGDGDVTWKYAGTFSGHYASHFGVRIFQSGVDSSGDRSIEMGSIDRKHDDSDGITGEVDDDDLGLTVMPGPCKIFAYALKDAEGFDGENAGILYTTGSDAETVELQPGHNLITLHLEPQE